MIERVISSLAILQVNWDNGQDYIDNFVPFVAECLRRAPNPEVSLPELQQAIQETFGLQVPQNALKTIVKRAVKAGYARAELRAFVRNDAALAELNIMEASAETLRKFEALLHQLILFAQQNFDCRWTPEEAEVHFLAYLEEHSIPVLAAAVNGSPIVIPAEPLKDATYIVYGFVLQLHERDPQGFDFLASIVRGRMLADVLLFPEIGNVDKKFSKVEVYLDTPFLLRALGYAPEARQAPCRELLELLNKEQAYLRVFDHTYDEIHNILDEAARTLQRKDFRRAGGGEALDFFIQTNRTSSYVETLIAGLTEALRGINVQIRPRPQYTMPLGVDEEKLKGYVREAMPGQHEGALEKDLASLTAIHRLREGRQHRLLETCEAVFVTSNDALARASARFFKEEYSDVTVPYCMLDHVLSTLVWLKCPMEASDLPRKRMIANCYAAMNPPPKLWKTYLERIDELENSGDISAQTYYTLRYSMDARSALMKATLGAAEAFMEGTVPEIIAEMQAAARAETEEQLRLEHAAHLVAQQERGKEAAARSTAEQAHLKEQEARLASEASLRLEATRRQSAEMEAAEATEKLASHRKHLNSVARQVGYGVSRSLLIAIIPVLALMIYLTLPKPFPQLTVPTGSLRLRSIMGGKAVPQATPGKLNGLHSPSASNGQRRSLASVLTKYIEPGLLGVLALLTLINAIFGTCVMSVIKRVETWVAGKFEDVLVRLMGA